MFVSVVVPFRHDGGHRDAAWRHVREWWSRMCPAWQVVEGSCPDGPWVKALAVADALTRADGDVLVVADADVLCDGVAGAVRAVETGAPWAIPHRGVYRLTEQATASVLAGGSLPDLAVRLRPEVVVEQYSGIAGGGMLVLPRALYERVPLDPRFAGWGGEDASHGHALLVMSGLGWRGAAPLWHLYHRPAPRLSRSVGSLAGLELSRRYSQAATPNQMAALLAEIEQGSGPLPRVRRLR